MKKNAIRCLAVTMITVMVFALTPIPVSAASKTPGKVKIKSVSVINVSPRSNTCTVTTKWKKVKKATGYIVYMKFGDNQWKKVKKVGRKNSSFKYSNVPCGQVQVKVQAVNKKKKGKFSAVKTKYAASPLNVENYVKYVEPEIKNMTLYGGTLSFSASRMIVTYDVNKVYSNASEINWNSPSAEMEADLINYLNTDANAKAEADKFRRFFDVSCGIKNFTYTARFVYNGNEIVAVNY